MMRLLNNPGQESRDCYLPHVQLDGIVLRIC